MAVSRATVRARAPRTARAAPRCAAGATDGRRAALLGAAALALAAPAPARAGLFGGPSPEELDAQYVKETEEFIAVIRACIEGGDPLVFRDASRNWLGAWRGRSGGPPGRGKSYLELANAANILGGHYAFSGEIDTMKQKDMDNLVMYTAAAEKALKKGI
eukprot:PRCOL_00004677-RA